MKTNLLKLSEERLVSMNSRQRTENGPILDRQRTYNGASTNSFGILRYAAMMVLLFCLGIGQMWGDQTWDYTVMSTSDSTDYRTQTSDWSWESGPYAGNKFTPTNGVWSSVISTTNSQIAHMRFRRVGSNMGTKTIRIHRHTNGQQDGYLNVNNAGSCLSIPVQEGDTLKVWYKNVESSKTAGIVLTNAKRIRDNQTTIQLTANSSGIDTLIVTSLASSTIGDSVEFKFESSKVQLQKLVLKNPVASGCPAFSFHTGGSDVWNTHEADYCFTQVGSTKEWRVEDYTRENHTHYVVNWQGGKYDTGGDNSASFASHSWSDMSIALARAAKVGESATGVQGILRLYADSYEQNLYVGFIPAGYVVRRGSDNFATTGDTESDVETVWRTGLQQITSSNAASALSVGLKTSSGSADYSQTKSVRQIFFQPNSNWMTAGEFYIYYWGDETSWGDDQLIDPDGDGIYEGWIPASGVTGFKFVRENPEAEGKPAFGSGKAWDETGNLTAVSGKNLFTLPDGAWSGTDNGTSDANWSLYEKYGQYRVWADKSEKNFHLHFYPHYAVLFNAGDGSGSMDAQSVAIDAATKNITLAACSLTAPTGYNFRHWTADVNVTINSSTVTAGSAIADKATLQSIGSDITLTAQWVAKSCDVTFDKNSGTGGDNGTTATYDAAMTSVTPPTRTNYKFDGYYDSESADNGTGTKYYNADGTSAKPWDKDTESATTLYAKWTEKSTPTAYGLKGVPVGLCDEETATITLTGSQSGVSYQLKKNGTDTLSAKAGTGSALEWEGMPVGTYTIFTVETANYKGGVQMNKTDSTSVTVTKLTTTAISTQPTTPVAATAGVNFTVGTGMVAAGESLTYRWLTCKSDGTDTVFISGATSSTYTTSKSAGTYYYRVKVSGTCGDPVLSNVITVTAVQKYSVTYDGNENTGGDAPTDASSPYAKDASVTVLGKSTLVKTNYGFAGWNTVTNGSGTWYVPGETFSMGTAAVTLNAQWVETATLEVGTLYKAGDMKAKAIGSSTGYRPGYSSNGIFELLGVGTADDNTLKNTPMEYGSDAQTIDGTSFTHALHFKGTEYSTPSGTTLPTARAIKFHVGEAGTLHLWVRGGKKINIVKDGGSAAAVGSDTDRTHETVEVTAGTWYLYGTGTSISLYGMKLTTCDDPSASFSDESYTTGGTLNLRTLWSSSNTTDGVTFTVTDAGGTSATIAGDGYTFSATAAGTATVRAVQTSTGDYCDADLTASITVSLPTYTVTYNTNDKTSGSAPSDASSPYESGSTVTVLGNTGSLARTGYVFLGWSTSYGGGTAYAPGETFTITGNTNLYPIWAEGTSATITYTMAVGTSNTWSASGSSNETTGIPNAGVTITETYAGIDGGTGHSKGSTAKLTIATGANGATYDSPTYYILYNFAVASGYAFTPSDITIKIANVGGKSANNIKYKAVLSDASSHSISTTYICTTQDATIETFHLYNEDGVTFDGNVSLKLWAWTIADKTDGGSAYRLGTPLTIAGALVQTCDPITATATAGTASVTGKTTASLPYTLSNTTNVASVTIKVYDDEDDLVETYEDVTSSPYAATGLSAGTTYTYTVTPIGESGYCNGSESSASSAFTTQYEVVYEKSGSETGSVPTDANGYTSGASATVLDEGTLENGDEDFLGWTDGTTFYVAGNTFTVSANTTLTAVWSGACAAGSGTEVYNGENVAKNNKTASGWTINNSSTMTLTSGSSNGYSYWYNASSSTNWVQFDGSASLVSGDQIKIQWTHGSANKDLALTINGSDASLTSGGHVSTANTKMEAVYDVTSTITVTSIKLNSSGAGGCNIYQVTIISGGGSSCYKVEFANGSVAPSTTLPDAMEGVPSGSKIVAPTAPTADGYTFGGWYIDAACGTSFGFSGTITQDTTLYAKWTANEYTVTFDRESGTGGSDGVTATYGSAMPSATMPTKAGYSFEGYWDGDNGTGTKYYNSDGSSAKDWDKATGATLYAKWTPVALTYIGYDWNSASSWDPACVPTIEHDVIIPKVCFLQVANAQAKSVTVHNYGDGKTEGKLYIYNGGVSSIGGLVVAEGIKAVHTEGGDPEPTTDRDLSIHTASSGNAGLVCGGASSNTQATYEFYSKVYRYESYYINQYVGIPFASMDPYDWYSLTIFEYDDTNDKWKTPVLVDGKLKPFTAYNIISKISGSYSTWYYLYGTLNLPGTSGTKPLTCGTRVATAKDPESEGYDAAHPFFDNGGDYMFANSWTAPISIKDMTASDISDVNDDGVSDLVQCIYIFNAGYVPKGDDKKVLGELSGTWSSFPFGSSTYMAGAVIPAGQAFLVTSKVANATLTLDYGKHVYNPALASGLNTSPLRAPRRNVSTEDPNVLRIKVVRDSIVAEQLYILEREDFTFGYDDGWDGNKIMGLTSSPQLYAQTGTEKMAVSAVPDITGLELGFKAGTDTNVYVLSFEYNDSEPLYLYDRQTMLYTLISNDATYSFTTDDTAEHARFILTRSNAPWIETGTETLKGDENRAEKFFDNNMLFIRRGEKVYNVDGSLVK